MIYKEFKDGIKLSALGMGVMRMPVLDGDNSKIDYEKGQEIIDRCMAEGINYYDTAYIYHGGKSEEFLGKALSKYPRDSYYITDKFHQGAEPDYRKQFSEHLARLNADYIDFFLLHSLGDARIPWILESGCIPYFDEMKKQGKIHYFGFSYHGSPEALDKFLDVYPWDFCQLQLNYYDWYHGDAKRLYEVAEKHGVKVMVMEPAHGGLLADLAPEAKAIMQERAPEASDASWAMRFVKELPNVLVVLSGMKTPEVVNDNVKTFSEEAPLSRKDHEAIRKAASIQYHQVAVPCTECRYCCTECPKGLDIPLLLKEYNGAMLGGGMNGGAWRLINIVGTLPVEKRPSACIGCGVCAKRCPQNFDIPKYMKELTEMGKLFNI